jgi:hypothetical protein
MKTSDFNKLAREQLLPLLPGFEVAKGMVFAAPIGDLLRGFTFQGSSYDKSFYLVAFVQPLYVPSDEEEPSFSERSPRFAGADEARDEIESFVTGPGSAFLSEIETPEDLAAWIEREETGHKPDPYALEALAYSLALARRTDDADRWLDVTVESAESYIRSDIEEGLYTKDEEHPLEPVLERAAQVREALGTSEQKAIALLEQWREETADGLGLSKHLAPSEHTRAG